MADERRDSDDIGSKPAGVQSGRSQAGGGPGPSDMAAPGGSSGSGGYGQAQNQQFHQGQQENRQSEGRGDGRSRGERFDEAQGGGRGPLDDDLATDQAEHQDRGQSVAEAEGDER
jgi:hypothetical protein